MQTGSSDLTPRADGSLGSNRAAGAGSSTHQAENGVVAKEGGDGGNVDSDGGLGVNTRRLLIRTGTDEEEVVAAAPLLVRTEAVGKPQPQLPRRPPLPATTTAPTTTTTTLESSINNNASPSGRRGGGGGSSSVQPISGSKSGTPLIGPRRNDIGEPTSEPADMMAAAPPQMITITSASGGVTSTTRRPPRPPTTPTGDSSINNGGSRTLSHTPSRTTSITPKPKLLASRSEELPPAVVGGGGLPPTDMERPQRRSVDGGSSKYTSPTRLAQCSGAGKP